MSLLQEVSCALSCARSERDLLLAVDVDALGAAFFAGAFFVATGVFVVAIVLITGSAAAAAARFGRSVAAVASVLMPLVDAAEAGFVGAFALVVAFFGGILSGRDDRA